MNREDGNNMSDEVHIPEDTLLRMALISEKHLSKEYEYMRKIVASHEREIAWLSLGLVLMAVTNYALIIKLYMREASNGSDSATTGIA